MNDAATTELTVSDVGYLNNWVFTSRNHGLVGTRDVPLLLLDLDADEQFAGVLANTGTIEAQQHRETHDYLEVGVLVKRHTFCVRLPLPEMESVAREIVDQGNVAFADFDAWYSDDDRSRTAVLITFE